MAGEGPDGGAVAGQGGRGRALRPVPGSRDRLYREEECFKTSVTNSAAAA